MWASAARARGGILLLVFASALLWGLYWIPIRALQTLGLAGPWAGFWLLIATVPLLLGLAAFNRGEAMSKQQWLGAACIGAAIALYSSAINYSDVIRVVLLFYFAPAWSTAIECLFMGRRWNRRSALALALSFMGIVFVCRGEVPLDGIGAVGDWMALLAGLSWSVGAALVFSRSQPDVSAIAAVTGGSAVLVAGICILVGGADLTGATLTGGSDVLTVALIALAFGVFYIAPVIFATLWGAFQLSPATMSFLLTAEIISGVASAAIFLGERFGTPEAIGTGLIALGAVIEIVIPAPPVHRVRAET